MKRFLAMACMAMVAVSVQAGNYEDISVADLEKAIKDGTVTVIDVNGKSSFEKGHIPGAVNFAAVEDLSKVLPEDKDALIVAYCGGPKCGAYKSGAKAATNLGYKNVKHLSAGKSGWKKAGKELEVAKKD
jgi:rhodanese-related sulfurtransferase